jgi:hypothetical protein
MCLPRRLLKVVVVLGIGSRVKFPLAALEGITPLLTMPPITEDIARNDVIVDPDAARDETNITMVLSVRMEMMCWNPKRLREKR